MIFDVLLSKGKHSLGKFVCESLHILKEILASKLEIKVFLSDATRFRQSKIKQWNTGKMCHEKACSK